MRGVEGKTGKRRFSFSYVLLIVSVVAYLGAWGYSSYASEWRARAEVPQIDGILKIIKGVRQYQRVHATFPQTLTQVEDEVWKHTVRPDYGAGGRSVVSRNYYYFYTWLNPTSCTLWAIPVGRRTGEANSYFVVLTPDDRQKWKGPPLDVNEASRITGTPTYAQLGLLGLVKQDALPQKRQ